jgi:cell division protein FtsI/penicillin-binding protein 2
VSGILPRSRILTALIVLASLVVLGRLAWLQLGQHEVWAERRRHNLKGFQWVPGMRGSILDRQGLVLAEDEPQFTLELRYRNWRRGHPVALLVHLDRFVRMLDEDSSLPAPPSPGGAEPLNYADFGRRFGPALQRVAVWPQRWLHKEGPLEGFLRATMRFYVMELVRLSIDPEVLRFRSQTRLGLRLDKLAPVPGDAPIFDVLAGVFGETKGRAGGEALFQQVYAGLDRAWRELQELEARLGDELLLRGASRQGARGSLRDFLDSIERHHVKLGQLLLERHERQEREGRDARLRWLRKLIGVWEAEPVRTEFTLAEQLYWRFRAEDRPLVVSSAIEFEKTAAWLGVRADRYPGFHVGETVQRQHPHRPDGEERYPIVGRVGLRWPQVREVQVEGELREIEEDPLDQLDPQQFLGVDESTWEELEPWLAKFWEHVRGSARRQGLTGIEFSLNDELVGRGGLRDLLRDRRGRELTSEQYTQATRGPDVRLTLDVRLQDLAQAALERYYEPDRVGPPEGSAIQRAAGFAVINAQSGDVLALASMPKKRRDRETGKVVPQAVNYAIRYGYNPVPGSVLKPFLVAYALKYGEGFDSGFRVCRPEARTYRCQDRPRVLSCHVHAPSPPGQEIEHAIANSCNLYFGQLADSFGVEGFGEMLSLFGLHFDKDADRSLWSPLGIGVSRPRLVPGRKPALAYQAIGYGIHVAPLSLARAYAGLATGRLPALRFVQSIGDAEVLQAPPRSLGVPRELLLRVHEGLRRVTYSGTARDVFRLGFEVAGKTGTPEITAAESLRRYRNNAVFCGFAPLERPRLAFAVMFHAVPDKSFQGKRAAQAVQEFLVRVESDAELRREYLESR